MNQKTVENLVAQMLVCIEPNSHERGGLIETPARVAKALKETLSGYGVEPADILKQFDDGAEHYDQMVIVKDIPLYSYCEHHMLPFFGYAHIGYIPDRRIVGLSKLNRLVQVFAKRLQVQERLTQQIASALEESLMPLGVAVAVECRHLCMEMRGVKQRSVTTTTALTGQLSGVNAKAEFLKSIEDRRKP